MPATLKIKRLNTEAKLPSYAHVEDAGLDVYALENMVIKKGERRKIGTGIALELPEGHVALIWDKSGLAANHGITNLGGVIDAGYRGECFVVLANLGETDYSIEKGDKIAQILIQKVEHMNIEEVQEVSGSSRGQGGFGSTGRK